MIPKKLIGTLWDGTKVLEVMGGDVRRTYSVDFGLGGHGYVYPWIPKDEIWVEKLPEIADEEANIAHEIVEYLLMRYDQVDYSRAHERGLAVERILRRAA